MTFDLKKLAVAMEKGFPDVLFAYVFGSARDGVVRPGSDVDVAVWIKEDADKLNLISGLTGLVESFTAGASCDLVFLNDAGDLLGFEALQGKILFIREEARDLHAGYYSQTCREYEDSMAWMKKQLQYRNYEVQWGEHD